MLAGRYDLKLVDQDGDVCVIRDVPIRYSRTVTIETTDLLSCQARR